MYLDVSSLIQSLKIDHAYWLNYLHRAFLSCKAQLAPFGLALLYPSPGCVCNEQTAASMWLRS